MIKNYYFPLIRYFIYTFLVVATFVVKNRKIIGFFAFKGYFVKILNYLQIFFKQKTRLTQMNKCRMFSARSYCNFE